MAPPDMIDVASRPIRAAERTPTLRVRIQGRVFFSSMPLLQQGLPMDSAAVRKVAPECPPGLQSRRTGRGEWPSGQKRQTVNLLKFFYIGLNPASPTCLL
ncbi:hypothetical protein KY284_030277 [Solanum tuberosum]|nr:hypothetical protein KY284_030277 [Solanum tuberosum]